VAAGQQPNFVWTLKTARRIVKGSAKVKITTVSQVPRTLVERYLRGRRLFYKKLAFC